MNNQQPLGMPQHCIETGESFVEAYGKEFAIEVTQGYYDTIIEAHGLIEGKTKELLKLKLKLGIQAAFWNEVKQSIDKPKLDREFFEILKPVQ